MAMMVPQMQATTTTVSKEMLSMVFGGKSPGEEKRRGPLETKNRALRLALDGEVVVMFDQSRSGITRAS